MTYYLDVEIVKNECHPHTVRHYTKKEDPIADFELTDIDLLDSALQQPKWDYYERIEKKQLFFTTA